MKPSRLFSATIVIWLFSLVAFAQEDSIPPQLKENIQIGFDNYKLKDSISIDPELEEELVEGYYQGYIGLDPKSFQDEKSKSLLQYYATPEGIEGLFRDWMIQLDTFASVSTIGDFLFINIFIDFEKPEQENTPKPEPLVKPESPKDTTPSGQSTSVNPTGRSRMSRERASGRNGALSQPPEPDRGVRSRNESAVVNSHESRMPVDTAVRAKRNTVIKKVPNKMLIARTMKFEEKRNLAISKLQDSVKLLPPNSQAEQSIRKMSTKTPNKYAILIINEPDKPTANIYLNGILMGKLVKIKNGILVRSKRHYNYEIKLVNAIYCSDTITLAPQEIKITRCKAH